MDIFIRPDGSIQAVYSDAVDYSQYGKVAVKRASKVEWEEGYWVVRFLGILGKIIPPKKFKKRSLAISWEVKTLTKAIGNKKNSTISESYIR